MTSKVSTAIVLFKKRKKKNGKYPAKLRLTNNRKQVYYSIDSKNRIYEFTEEEFTRITAPKPRGLYKEIQLELSLIEEKAQTIIKNLSDFTFDQFKTHFGVVGSNMKNVYHYLDLKFGQYKKTGHGDKNASAAKKSLQQFFKREKQLEFKELTVDKFKEFENFMRAKGISPTTYRRYVDSIKCAFIMAQKESVIPKDLYPFGRDKYFVPRVLTVKRALKLEEIEKIYNYAPIPFTGEDYAKDFWMFTYLCNGINMTDICNLKYKDIGDDFITFVRKKTEHTGALQKPIFIAITDDIRRVIAKWGNEDTSQDTYVFPFLYEGLTVPQQQYKIAYRVRKINTYMDRIRKKVGIEKKVTTYTARHSFATILKRSGVSIEFISESLGHRDLKMTETYLDSFENEQRKEVVKHLTAFK